MEETFKTSLSSTSGEDKDKTDGATSSENDAKVETGKNTAVTAKSMENSAARVIDAGKNAVPQFIVGTDEEMPEDGEKMEQGLGSLQITGTAFGFLCNRTTFEDHTLPEPAGGHYRKWILDPKLTRRLVSSPKRTCQTAKQ